MHEPAAKEGLHTASRRSLLRAAASLPLAWTLGCSREGGELGRPLFRRGRWNLLVLVADDASRLNFGAYGNRSCTTPNIDRLAREGMRFDRAYTPVSLCSPSRASMYTGLYPIQHRAAGFEPVRDTVPTWPELFAGVPAVTGMIGKLHVEPAEKFPFDFANEGDELLKQRSPLAFERAFETFLDQAAGQPFTLFVNFKDPHRPFGHKREEDRGGPARIHVPEDIELFPFLYDTPGTRVDLARYYDALARLDETVGRLLARLEARALASRTVVVFTSDNGMPFPFAKSTLFEAGINLPFLVRWPGVVPPGSVSRAMVSLLDLLPTALDLFGAPAPDGLVGHSLLPLLRGQTPFVRQAIFGMHSSQKVGQDYPIRSVRTYRLKYIRNLRPEVTFDATHLHSSMTWNSWLAAADRQPELEERMELLLKRPREQLYNLEDDPYELNDLAPDPARAETLANMSARVKNWMAVLDDPLLGEW